MKQYEMMELTFHAPEPRGSQAAVDLKGRFEKDGKTIAVRGFYAGNDTYKVRFLPEEAGEYAYIVTGGCLEAPVEGCFTAEAADAGRHGPVRAAGVHLRYADGTWFNSFGTTVYALIHQPKALIDETMQTLSAAPFNKVRLCVFPKHYSYNHNEPDHYPFERKPGAEGHDFSAHAGGAAGPGNPSETAVNDTWDVDRPCFAFWDALEARLKELDGMGIQADLILFHPYDRWGFATMPMEDNLVYLDYLTRRLSAFPNVWWSLANEYDLCMAKTPDDWRAIETFVAERDPFRHMLSCHNCFEPWDFARPNTTHVSWQTKQLYRVAELMRRYGKPVLIDECRYEGNLPQFWGNISGEEMTARFWRATVQGGFCTHGETFLPGTEMAWLATKTGEEEVVWWARGGRLNGESPARIAFLRRIVENLPGLLTPLADGLGCLIGMTDEEARAEIRKMPADRQGFLSRFLVMERGERDKFLAHEYGYAGHCGEEAYLWYKDDQCCAEVTLSLPEDKTYSVDVIDTWNMTVERVAARASGRTVVALPGRPWMAVRAVALDSGRVDFPAENASR